MNARISFLPSLFAAMLCACQGLQPAGPGTDPQPEPPLPPVTLELGSSFDSRTTLGPLQGNVYPVYWSNGDRICVNGVKSSTLYGLEAQVTRAFFTVEGVSAPYHIVYPSIFCMSMDADGVAQLTLPVAQAWTPDSFADFSAVMYGSTENASTSLQNLCGVVRLPLVKGSSDGENIRSITVSSASAAAPLAGDFTLDTRSGELTARQGSSSLLLAMPPEGVVLSEDTPQYFCISVPAGKYPEGFSLLLDGPGGNMLCDWKEETEVPAGVVVTLKQIAFKPNNTKLIDGIDSWNEFALAMNAGDYEHWINPDTGEISLVADISYGGDLTPINALPSGVVFNGGGHAIKRARATEALFTLIEQGATVKNLTVGGTRVAASSVADRGTGNLAAFNRGTIENCENAMAVDLSGVDQNIILAGLVTDNAGLIKDSKNTGDISVSMTITANRTVYGGGICARAQRNLGEELFSGSFENCENSGNIVIKRMATGIFSLTKFALGGIAGFVYQGTSDGVHSTFRNCVNSGNITYWQDEKHTNANYGYCVGGILGRNILASDGPDFYVTFSGANNGTAAEGFYIEMENCRNTGNIDVSIYSATVTNSMSGARQVYVGGLVGALQASYNDWADIRNCSSVCDIRVGSGARADCTGGLFGAVGQANVTNCKADVGISLSKNNIYSAQYMGCAGGAAGFVGRDALFKDLDITLRYDRTGASNIFGAGFVGLVAKNTNLKIGVQTQGYATLTLEGANYFSGTIAGLPVTEDNVAISNSLGYIVGNITIK